MKQALIKKGIVYGEEVPAPLVSKGSILIKVVNSCISAGTEITGVVSSGIPLIQRISKQPEKISKALNLVRSDGIVKAYKQIRSEMEAGRPTGYSVSGMVIATGEGVSRFKPGDRVAAAGGGLANHAEYVDVPENLVVPIPDRLGFLEASTVTLGAIAMHGVRRAGLSLGEFCVVYGTGILGLLTIQMLKKSGVRVIAIDIDPHRLEIARKTGAEVTVNPSMENQVETVMNVTDGYGADAVLFTASSSSSEPLSHAFNMCRKKGRVILVGVSGMEIKREDIYQKEIDFMISSSYGPGRYDKKYEQQGMDYPYAYVRWTENRNLREYLRMLISGNITLKDLISAVFPVEQLTEAFASLQTEKPKPLMVILDYGDADLKSIEEYRDHPRSIKLKETKTDRGIINVALIGAGSFATHIHLPNIDKLKNKMNLHAVVDHNGSKARSISKYYGAAYATTRIQDVLDDKDVHLVMICTRHDTHGTFTLEALKHGKHVFVEKPLAIHPDELKAIDDLYSQNRKESLPLFMVGFNRRFSPFLEKIKKQTDTRVNPLFIHYRMNAGQLPKDHWVYSQGGRIIGEGCHIIDLFLHLTGSPVRTISFNHLHPKNEQFHADDNVSITLSFHDGSIAVLDYFSTGNSDYPKEFMEIHFDRKTITLNDYRILEGYGINLHEKSSRPEKGHLEELKVLYNALNAKIPFWPIPYEQMIQTTKVTHLFL